jgi:hypothetical protein
MQVSCLTNEQLVDYFDKKWLPEQTRLIELHIAECDVCAAAATNVFSNLGAFDAAFDNKPES